MTLTLNNRMSSLTGRSGRISVAVGVAATLGLADLWLTVYFMQTTGMSELNPLARLLAGFGPGALVVLKVVSLMVNAGLLLACRKRPTAELGAWASVVVMAVLTAHWHNYTSEARQMTCMDQAVLAADPTFVKIGG